MSAATFSTGAPTQSCLSSVFPNITKVTQLTSTLEIKQRWLQSEWYEGCPFSWAIRPDFPDKKDLDPNHPTPDIEKIERVFNGVRGKFDLWGEQRENARWTKVELELPLDWAKKNIKIKYPVQDRFPVSKLDGIVLWDEGQCDAEGKLYQLYEGNHRFSAWFAAEAPSSLPAVIFIGQPKKSFT